MARRTRSKLIEFLTSQDNLPSVLAILPHHDEIHRVVLSQLWTCLEEHLVRKVRRIVQRGIALHWEPSWRADPTKKWTGIQLFLDGSQDQAQALTFYIEQAVVERREYSLQLGLYWMDQVKPRSSVLRVPEVQRVAEQLQQLEFEVPRPPTWWHGRKDLAAYAGLDEFLVEYVEQPEPLLRKVSEPFWRHVKDTYALVVRANKAIAARGR